MEVENARVVLGFGSYAVGQFEGSLRALEGKGAAGSVEEVYDWTLRVLGNAVKGASPFSRDLSSLFFRERD